MKCIIILGQMGSMHECMRFGFPRLYVVKANAFRHHDHRFPCWHDAKKWWYKKAGFRLEPVVILDHQCHFLAWTGIEKWLDSDKLYEKLHDFLIWCPMKTWATCQGEKTSAKKERGQVVWQLGPVATVSLPAKLERHVGKTRCWAQGVMIGLAKFNVLDI